MNKYQEFILKNIRAYIASDDNFDRNSPLSEFLMAIQNLRNSFPNYDIMFENDKLIFKKNGIIIKELSLPYQKTTIEKIFDAIGLENCLGKGCKVN